MVNKDHQPRIEPRQSLTKQPVGNITVISM
ncbi:unnamed protein product, partial [Rotaria sp. Silwood1]